MAQPYASAPPMVPASNPANLITKVQLSLSCKGLVNKDLLSKSDPLAVVYIFSGNQWVEVCFVCLHVASTLQYTLIVLENSRLPQVN